MERPATIYLARDVPRGFYGSGVKAYLKSGKPGRYLIIAGLAGVDAVWRGFDERWSRVLSKHNLSWWRATDAINTDPSAPRESPLDPRLGWDRTRAEAAMNELGDVIRDTHAEHFDACTLRSGVQVMTCVVDLDAYAEAKARDPLLRAADAICANVCVSGLLAIGEASGALYVEQGGGFMQEIEDAWRVETATSNSENAGQVEIVGLPREAHPMAGLQAADLLVWSTHEGVQRAAQSGSPAVNIFGKIQHYYGLEELARETRHR
jgi:hypothetical protein